MTNEASLKPCPFCGSPAEYGCDEWDSIIQCTKCTASVVYRFRDEEPYRTSILEERWNRRADEPPAPPAIGEPFECEATTVVIDLSGKKCSFCGKQIVGEYMRGYARDAAGNRSPVTFAHVSCALRTSGE